MHKLRGGRSPTPGSPAAGGAGGGRPGEGRPLKDSPTQGQMSVFATYCLDRGRVCVHEMKEERGVFFNNKEGVAPRGPESL